MTSDHRTSVWYRTSPKVFILILIVALGIGYIGKITNTSTKGYAIRDLEVKVKQLQQEEQQLSVEIAQYSSMQTVRKRVEQLGMEQTDAKEVEYVKSVEAAVARR